MGKTLARQINGMSLWTKIGVIMTLLTGILVYQGVFRPGFLDSATNTYYFTTDSTAVNVGADGTTSTSTSTTSNKKISMKTGVYATSRSVVAASNTTAQTMLRVYGPAYGTMQTVTAPAITIGVRDRNGTANTITWWAEVYDYTPSGAANNGVLLWTSNVVEAHPSVQTPLELPFANPLPKDVAAGHRLKVVVKCQMSNIASSARLYWGSSTNYSFFTVTEANYVANSLTVTNLSDYYNGSLTNVTQGDTNIPLLKWDMYSNVGGGATWSGGKIDRIGTNTSLYLNPDEPGDASFSIWKDADGDGVFEITDTKIGGPYTFGQLTGQTYALTTNQTITSTIQRYFITYDVLRTATPSTTVGARIVNSTYFTVVGAAGGVQNVSSTSSSAPNIDYGGVAVSKVYKADWDSGTSLGGISETGGTQPSPNQTDSACIVRNTNGSGFPLVGLVNYPAHTCTSVAGQGYLNASGSTQADFARLYFGGTGYPSAMKSIKGTSFTYRVYFPTSGGTVTLRLFYVTSGGVRVNAPIASTYTRAASGSTVNQAVTTSLAGQNFSDVPQGARLGIQIGVTNNVRIGLGSANGMTGSSSGANLTVQETAAENENVDVGNGTTVPNLNVYAGDTGKVLNSFTLTSAKEKTVTAITLTGSALFNATNIKNVKLYQDTGTYGVLDGETAIATLPGSSIVGNSITLTPGTALIIKPTVKRYLVLVDIADIPNVNVIVKALVSGVTVATSGGLGNNTDSSSATLTIQPTTTMTDGAAEPVSKIVNAAQVATLIDAFGLKTNGGINDQVNTVTVTLSTTSPVPAGHYLSEYVSKVEIVNQANTVVYGHLTSPTYLHLDQWQVATTNLYATAAGTECYVRITPKSNLGGTYVVKAAVTSLTHLRTINRLATPDDDITSASITLDGAAPANAGNFTASTPPNAAAVSLNWDPATDASGSAVSYTVVRGLGNAPVPKNCTPSAKVIQVYQGTHPGTSPDVTESGLEEGVIYNYRICSTDGVGNTSLGVTSSAGAGIINRCDQAPTLLVSPSATYINAGETKQLQLSVTNNDTGTCGSASTFHLTITGTPNTDDFNAPTLETNDFVLPTNGGAKFLKLNVTAKAGAPYRAMTHFGVKVDKSGASVATVEHADPVHVMVNKYGAMMHSSMQLGSIRFGQWGTEYDCSTCHSDSSSNIKRVIDTIQTPTGPRSVVFTTLSASESVFTGVMGNDLRPGTTSSNVCEVCHHKTRYHQYSTSKVAWKTHNNSSDCMRCHDHRYGFKTISEGRRCTDCHGEPPITQAQLVIPPTNVLFPYATGDDAGAHAKHQARQLACEVCHNNGNHLISAMPDSKLDIGFNIRSSHYPGFNPAVTISSGTLRSVTPANDFVYAAGAGTTIDPAFDKVMTCSVYCHGYWNNSNTISGGYNTEPSWSGTTQTGCGSCHGASGSQPPTTGSHPKHAGITQGYGNGIACTACHGFRNYSTSAQHINGNVEWDLSAITPTATYNDLNKGSTGAISPTPPGSYDHCDNLYCHSNVQSANGTAGATTFGTPIWGSSVSCGDCHTHSDTGGHVSGGHSQHTAPPDVEGFDCRICHGNGGSTNSLNHANSKINFSFSGLAENTVYSEGSESNPGAGGYGTCSTGNCHGRAVIAWGPVTGRPLCEKCHSTTVTPAGFYGTAGPGSTKVNTDPYVGAHFQHLTSMPYKLSAKYDCNQCHVKPTGPYSPGHIDTALSAEINFNNMSSLANRGAQNGYSSAGHQPSYDYALRQCNNVWCHGAGMNSNEGTGPYGSVGPGLDGGTLGAPDARAAIWNQPFLATAPDKCQTCHATPPAAPESGYMHYDDDTGAPYARDKCTNCHREVNTNSTAFVQPELHVNGIIDSCYNCHGRPPVDDETMTKPALGALGVGMVGAHQAHRLNPAIGNDCGACHYNYAYDMPSYKLEIGFRAYGNRVTKGIFWGMSTLPTSSTYGQEIVYFSTWTSTKVLRTNNTAKINTCENLYCHGGGTNTLAALSGGSNTKPNWEAGSSQAVCGACHGVTGETYRTSSHGAHVGYGFGEPRLACNNCHGVKENNYHVDGKVEWEFYSSALRMNDAATAAGYVGTIGYKPAGVGVFAASGFADNLAPSANYGTCQVYCHSDPYDKTFKIATWGSAAMTCDSCHRNQTSAGRYTKLHQKHAASSANGGYGIECAICHNGSGSGNPLHVNGSVDIIFNSDIVGASAVYDKTAKKCFNSLCHISTVNTGPTWVDGSTDGRYQTGAFQATCIGCHSGEIGARAAVVSQFAGSSHHVQTQISNGVCYQCHIEGNANGTANEGIYHDRTAGKPVDLVVWGAGARGAAFTRYTANGMPSRKRTEYAKLNNHCLGCHNATNAAITPFGDGKTPESYAWDGTSVAERYSVATTTPWAKVTGNNTAVKNNVNVDTKAYSAHGRADLNERGWAVGNATTGETYTANTSGTVSVLCFDCHNSHGTNASGVMSSYSSATGRYQGGILKSTANGISGYSADYVPTAGGDAAAPNKNAYNAGASLCFDCHNTRTASDTAPWGYNSTFSATAPIYGYHDKPYFGNYSTFASTVTYAYKKDNADNKGGHYGASSDLTTAVTQRTFSNGIKDHPYVAGSSSPINGLCTPCHDPHGVSPSLGASQQYAVPLLKGTWVTSPYKQDVAPANTNETRGGGNRKAAINVGSTPKYYIDQTSMGQTAGAARTAWTFPGTPGTLQPRPDTDFAGLCTGCHAKASINNTANASSSNWKSVGRIHNSVKGWATATGGNANNSKHAFTCSKCHTPHNARLPRLMVTNCLDAKHRGRVASGGETANAGTSAAAGNNQSSGSSGAGAGRFPMGGGGNGSRIEPTAGKWFFGSAVESKLIATTSPATLCHQTATSGGTVYNTYTSQKWNKKTQW